MTTFVLYPLLTTAAYFLGSRASITQFIWRCYPKWLDYYMLCAACSGFLYGLVVAFAIGWWRDLPFLGLSGRLWVTPIVVGFCSIVWTPLLADKHIAALNTTSVSPDDNNPDEVNRAEKEKQGCSVLEDSETVGEVDD